LVPENRVRRDDRSDVTQAATAQPMPAGGQPSALGVGQGIRPRSCPVFLALIGPPARHGHHEESNRGDIHDRRSLRHPFDGPVSKESA